MHFPNCPAVDELLEELVLDGSAAATVVLPAAGAVAVGAEPAVTVTVTAGGQVAAEESLPWVWEATAACEVAGLEALPLPETAFRSSCE